MDKDPFDLSLRLWSDVVALVPVVARLGLPARHLYVRGQPMAAHGPHAGRPARRHYAALATARASDTGAAQDWLKDVLARVGADTALIASLHSGEIEGTIWLAVFGRGPTPSPAIATRHVDAVRRLGLSCLVENYTAFEEATGLPRKTWLVAALS